MSKVQLTIFQYVSLSNLLDGFLEELGQERAQTPLTLF